MLRKILTAFVIPLIVVFGPRLAAERTSPQSSNGQGQSGTLQKMIVGAGSVTMQLDLNRLNGSAATTGKTESLHFAVGADSFFTVLIFNDLLRGPEQGSMALVPQYSAAAGVTAAYALPVSLSASIRQLTVEKLASTEAFDLAVRDAKSGFTFFNVDGHQYDYDLKAQSVSLKGGRLLMSKEFANALGRPADAGTSVGKISISAVMQPIQVSEIINGEAKSVRLPALHQPLPGTTPGPDVIVGDLPAVQQFGSAGTQVGVAIATTSCNAGTEDLDWFALPQTDHPVIPQNLYRMSGGADNTERFEQIGQSWLKHAFTALTQDACGFGCNGVGGPHLGSGCSDPYSASLNGGQTGIGSRAWVNPFTGAYPSTANNHSSHAHDGVSHRVRIEADDLNQNLNQGATYFAEAQYVTPHEYTWCQAHSGQCNMYNNVSYRQYSVSGTTSFTFSPLASTVLRRPAFMAWAGATMRQFEPDPGNDGLWFMAYKVTNPSPGVWHYEYALYNENLDRAIQSFSVPVLAGANISNIGFHAPPQEPGWANDGTFNNQGYSSAAWTVTHGSDSITWNCETFAQNQNANAIRWGTLYNFRFDADQPPRDANAAVGYYKTGSPGSVAIQAPVGTATPTPTATATATATATGTATATPTATATATATVTPSSTPTASPRPTPSPRSSPEPRPRPSPAPRP
jgi:hypothetical protein